VKGKVGKEISQEIDPDLASCLAYAPGSIFVAVRSTCLAYRAIVKSQCG